MRRHHGWSILIAAAPALAASGLSRAAEPMAPFQLNTTASEISAGVGYADSDGRRFGQYNGINESGAYALFDFSYVTRNDESGTWLGFFGRSVGLDSRELRFEQSRQGNWGYSLEYSRIPRFEPLQITSAVQGIESANLQVPAVPTTGGQVDLKTIRDRIGVGLNKAFGDNWEVDIKFRTETKEGARLFARGTTGGGPAGSFGLFEFAPEPIDSTTHQVDVKLAYSTSDLQLVGGYYGSFYNNQNNALNFTGGNAGLASFNPLALPPDNHAHQLYFTGSYGFTPTTRGNFKVAYGRAEQEDLFVTGVNVPLAAGIGNNLQGRIDTKLVQAGITSQPMPKLSLLANFRYEDRDDKTPVLFYLTPAASTSDGANEPRSIRTTTGKVEASYALPNAFRLTGGIDYEEKKRNTSPVRVVSFREKTEEISYRVELRRMMSETVTGALAYIYSDRDGSDWVTTTQTSGALGSNLIAPIHLADRQRDKVRLSINWMPIDALTLNLLVDQSKDDYDTHPGSTLGPMSGRATNVSIDADYVFNDSWRANAWYSRNDTKAEQRTCVGASAAGVCGAPTWSANLENSSDSFGLGLHAKPLEKLDIGMDASYSKIQDQYDLKTVVGAPITSLPDISTKLTRVNLFGKYALQKNAGVRLDYIYDRYSTDDWTWSTWMYADGTRISNPSQHVNFVGVSYFYKFQ